MDSGSPTTSTRTFLVKADLEFVISTYDIKPSEVFL